MELIVNITFYPGGNGTVCVDITINEDQTVEGSERFFVILSGGINTRVTRQVLSRTAVVINDTNGKNVLG